MGFVLQSVELCGCNESKGCWKTGGGRLDHRVGVNRTLAEYQQKAGKEDCLEPQLKL